MDNKVLPVKESENMIENIKSPFTKEEQVIMDNLVLAWNNFLKLDNRKILPSYTDDFCNAIHSCQRILGML